VISDTIIIINIIAKNIIKQKITINAKKNGENNMSVGDQVRDFVKENFLFRDTNITFDNSDSFMGKGIIDSTGVLELVSFIEERFDFRVHDEEIIPDNLDSIKNLTSFIEKKNKLSDIC